VAISKGLYGASGVVPIISCAYAFQE
jgi:WD40 repeat protein